MNNKELDRKVVFEDNIEPRIQSLEKELMMKDFVVLLVQDNDANVNKYMKLIRSTLKYATVRTSTSVKDALTILNFNEVNLVLSSYRLNCDEDGNCIYNYIKNNKSKTEFRLISNYEKAEIKHLTHAGINMSGYPIKMSNIRTFIFMHYYKYLMNKAIDK